MGGSGRGRVLARGTVCCVVATAILVLGAPVVKASAPSQSGSTPKKIDPSSLPPIQAPNGSPDLKPTRPTGGDQTLPSAAAPGGVALVNGKKGKSEFNPATEITAKRTAVSAESVNPDGSHVVRLFNRPFFFDTGRGFEPIDNSVSHDPAHPSVFTTKANTWHATFAPLGEGGVSVVDGTKSLSFTPDGAADVAPSVGEGDNANVVTYTNAWPGIDLVYRVETDQVKEDIVLHDGSRSSFSFTVPDANLTPKAGKAGQAGALARVDQAGQTSTLSIGAPVVQTSDGRWLDAAKPTQSVAPAGAKVTSQSAGTAAAFRQDGTTSTTLPSDTTTSTAASTSTTSTTSTTQDTTTTSSTAPSTTTTTTAVAATPAPGASTPTTGSTVTVGVDPAWLKSLSKSDFPIVIDPTVFAGGYSDVWASMRSDGKTVCGPTQAVNCNLLVGSDTTSFWRAVIHFPYETYMNAHPGARVTNADINLWRGTLGTTDTEQVNVTWGPQPWSYSNMQSGPLTPHDTLYPDWTGRPGYLTTQPSSAPIIVNTTELYDWFFENHMASQMMFLQGVETAGVNTLKEMGASLDLTVDNPPPPPTPISPNDGFITSSLTPTLTGQGVTDPDGNSVTYQIVVGTDPGGFGQVWQSGWAAGPGGLMVTVPDGTLQPGRTYYWRVDASDGFLQTAGTPVRSFTVNRRPGPDPTQPLDHVGPVTVNAANGNLTTTITPYSVPTLGGAAGISLTYNSQNEDQGLLGSYYAVNSSTTSIPTTPPTMTRVDSQVLFNWGYDSPSPALPADYFMAKWTGFVNPPPGTYTFGVWTDDGTRLKIDGSTIQDTFVSGNDRTQPQWASSTTSSSTTPPHAIEMDYREQTGVAATALLVRGTGIGNGTTDWQLVPASWLTPTRHLPTGWALSGADQPGWQQAVVTASTVTLIDPTGGTAEYTKSGSNYVPPLGENGIVHVNASDGTVSLVDTDGMTYLFGRNGALVRATSGADDLNPSALTYNYSGDPAELSSIHDPASNRDVTLHYQGDPGFTCPTASTFDSPPPAGMLCRVDNLDGTQTQLLYYHGLLALIIEPGTAYTEYGYDTSGKMSGVRDTPTDDAIIAGVRSASDITTVTQISYDANGRVATVTAPRVNTSDPSSPQHIYDYLTNTSQIISHGSGTDAGVGFGTTGDIPVVGDWNHSGKASPGFFRPSDQKWYLTNSNSGNPSADYTSTPFGTATDVPVAGDWSGSGHAGIGYYRPSTSTWYLSNSVTSPTNSYTPFVFGTTGDIPVVGDWDGNGTFTPGVYRPSNRTWYLRNSNSAGAPDLTFVITGADATSQPLAADWNGDHITTPGWRTANGDFVIRNTNTAGAPDNTWANLDPYGTAIVGDWNGNGHASPGRFMGGSWLLHDATSTLRTVTFDASGRVTSDTDPTGRSTAIVWDNPDQPLVSVDPAGMYTSNRYDTEGRLTDTYGPAPSTCFTTANPIVPNGTCTNPPVPHTHKGYDEGITGLAGAYYPNATLSGSPVFHDTSFGGGLSKNWSTTPPEPGLPSSGWSARFTGHIVLLSGSNNFSSLASSSMQIWIDGHLVLDTGADPGSGSTLYSAAYNNTGSPTAPHNIEIDVEETNGTAGTAGITVGVSGFPPSGAIAGSTLSPDYGLTTSTATDDSNGVPQSKVASVFANPENGLVTSSTTDPSGLALTTETDYEPLSVSTFTRRTAKRLPAVAGTGTNTTTYGYYTGSYTDGTGTHPAETRTNPCPGGTTENQASQLKTTTDATPASGTAIVHDQIYDSGGRVVASEIQSDGSSGWNCATYDSRGRPLTQTIQGSGARTVKYDYAVGGNPLVTAVCDGNVPGSPTPLSSGPCNGVNGVIQTTTDILGRVVSYTDVWGKTTTTSYDAIGRVVTTVGPQGTLAAYYDSAGRFLEQRLDGATVPVSTATNDSAGRLDSANYSNGTSLASINGTSGRDSLGRQVKQSWQFASTATATDQVTRSQTGKVVDESIDGVDAHSGNNFTYDGAGRLVDAYVPGHHYTYGFAASGGCGADAAAGKNTNRTSFIDSTGSLSYGYCYDNADRLTSTTDPTVGTIGYDSHGNTTTIAGETLSYDGANRHLRTQSSTTDVSYQRDVTDRIVARTSPAPGAIIDRGGATSSTSPSTTSLSISVPTTTHPGDVLLADVGAGGGSATSITAPAGWTPVDDTVNGASLHDTVYWHVAGASEPASYAWAIANLLIFPAAAAGGMMAFGGVDIGSPIDVSLPATTTGTSLTAPLVTTNVGGDELVSIYSWNGGGTISTGPTGMGQQYSRAVDPERTAGYDQALGVAGSTGTRTLTISASAAGIMHSVALKPALLHDRGGADQVHQRLDHPNRNPSAIDRARGRPASG